MLQRFRTARLDARPHHEGMGHFYINADVASVPRRHVQRSLRALVDTGSEYTWLPEDVLTTLGVEREIRIEFVTADGRLLERDAGYAFLTVDGWTTVDTVVFAIPSDTTLLGAHTLEGLNLNVDTVAKRLVPGGPLPAPATIMVSRTR